MKKTGLINSEISAAVALMGEGDTIAIVGACEPIPRGTKRIDLAVVRGVPEFETVLDAVLGELAVKEIAVPLDLGESEKIGRIIDERFSGLAKAEVMPEQFRIMLSGCRAVIRTGETSAHAGVILVSAAAEE